MVLYLIRPSLINVWMIILGLWLVVALVVINFVSIFVLKKLGFQGFGEYNKAALLVSFLINVLAVGYVLVDTN